MNVLNDNWDIVVLIIMIVVLVFLLRIFIQRLINNKYNYRMKETIGIIVDAKVVSWIYLLGRPTRYIVKVEYYVNNEKKSKRLVTSGKFAEKYGRERDIQVVMIPNTGKVYFIEEDWKKQNIALIVGIIFTVSFLCGLIFMFFVLIVDGILSTAILLGMAGNLFVK